MTTTLLDLAPNRLLLDPNFDGYKLSLREIPTKKRALEKSVDRVLLTNNQYSLLFSKVFGLHNHLIGDPFEENESAAYFIDDEWSVNKIYIDPLSNELIDPVQVWQIPKNRERRIGDYNVSMKFVSSNIAVLGDGTGLLYILDTGSKANDDIFSSSFADEVAGQDEGFIIIDAILNQENKDTQVLHVLLLSIKQENSTERFSTLLHWITITHKDGKWGQIALKQLTSKGNIEYAALEKGCETVYVVSDAECKFIVNSDCPVTNDTAENETTGEEEKIYKWSQNTEEIAVKINLPENAQKELVYVKCEPTQIEVKYDNKNLISGQLHQSIDADLASWCLEQNILEINLTKGETGLMWPEFVKDDNTGEHVLDSCIVEEVHERLAHLCSDSETTPQGGTTFNSQQVEECDFECDTTSVFARLNGSTNKITHKVNLGSHQVLLTVNLNIDLPPAIGIRHDVDACIWQPQGRGDNFSITHESTLLAFGYVQASKKNRKFTVCPPDMGYTVISEFSGHIFIYKQNLPVTSGELRNRSTGRRVNNIAEQQVLNISNSEILGIYPYNSLLYLLTEKSVTVLQL